MKHFFSSISLVVGALVVVGSGAASAAAQVSAMPPSGALDVADFPAPIVSGGPEDLVVDLDSDGPLPRAALAQRGVPADVWERSVARSTWQVLPDGLLYPAYLAGGRESRFATQWVKEQTHDWFWDVALGGHVGILRYGTRDPLLPEGWQIDIEGAAFPRLTLDEHRDLVSADFRFGIPITVRRGRWEGKFGYYHLSSHMGDEYLLKHGVARRNYVRDALVLGLAVRLCRDWRFYAEAGWAFYLAGGSKPWEFQFGIDYSPVRPTGLTGAPFLALNTRLREEVDYGGNMTFQAGWQWRGRTGHLFRTGLHYFNGLSDQAQFLFEHEQQVGIGVWYDY